MHQGAPAALAAVFSFQCRPMLGEAFSTICASFEFESFQFHHVAEFVGLDKGSENQPQHSISFVLLIDRIELAISHHRAGLQRDADGGTHSKLDVQLSA